EERTIALRRRSDTGHEHVVAVLEHDLSTGIARLAQRRAGVVIRIFGTALEQLAWRRSRRVDHPGAHLARIAIAFVQPDRSARGPGDALETELRLRELRRRRGERRELREHTVAEIRLGLRIAAIERLGVDERGRLRGAPLRVARTGLQTAA